MLAGRTPVPPSVTILLRARADLDAGRLREAALQLRVGLEALLAELGSEEAPALAERREITGAAANEALEGDLSPERAAEFAETLAICERALRRRRAST